MTNAEIFAVYGAPLILVVGGALMAWRNHVVMRRARDRDRHAAQMAQRPRGIVQTLASPGPIASSTD